MRQGSGKLSNEAKDLNTGRATQGLTRLTGLTGLIQLGSIGLTTQWAAA